jgi:glycosyltransferase involved in cell wall biosynthesis
MKTKTVTVGIPAYNEEKGIIKLIDKLLSQDEDGYKLEKIVVADDGSRDKTRELVKNHVEYGKKLVLLEDDKRMGQASRINQLFKLNTSDYFITIDADSVPRDDKTVMEIVKAFESKVNVGMVAGNDQPMTPNTLFGKIVKTGIDLWYEARKNINNGDCVQNSHGCVLAFTKQLAKTIEIPTKMFGFDEYLYFATKQKGYGFTCAPKAVVFYKTAENLSDYLKQNSRYLQTEQIMKDHFGEEIYTNQKPTLTNKLAAMWSLVKRSPILLMMAMMLQIILRILKPLYIESSASGQWTVIGKSRT